ncbi:GlxA family transcriptional regulator [Aestuariispira ectoiniformans]|uniref:GlxA family transcriptional regulator n=1 Tax=Aestuariispira ectoiniformans TaxID=2775080 RepID=UPI00223BCAA8|nr:GlxA family transcriptional regulator [Aestuariispira ectoiniformans]
MFGQPPLSGPQKLAFLLLDRFSLMAFSSASEPLRIANWLAGKQLYDWTLLTVDGAPAIASNNMQAVADAAISDDDFFPMTVVCTSFSPEKVTTPKVMNWLRRQERRGSILGAVDTGAHVLASAGLLNGYQATIHWVHQAAFAESFPEVWLVPDIYVVDKDRFTSSGGASAMDMMLHLIQAQHGREFAVAVADQFTYGRIREGHAPQRSELRQRLFTVNRKVLGAVDLMESHLEDPLRPVDIADMLDISLRELERSFRKALHSSPGAYYRMLRLEKARALLQQTDMSIMEVAVASGFSSSAHFSRAYKDRYGHPPSQDRRV